MTVSLSVCLKDAASSSDSSEAPVVSRGAHYIQGSLIPLIIAEFARCPLRNAEPTLFMALFYRLA